MIQISAPSRLHITLLSMNDKGYRKNGGIGFSINGFDTKIHAIPARFNSVKITCENNNSLSNELRNFLNHIHSKLPLKHKIEVNIVQKPASHIGLGTGTTLKLAIIEAVLYINSVEYSEEKIIKISNRGGTSGIGINTYFSGGFVFDLGRSSGSLKPSNKHSNEDFEKPLLLRKLPMPCWDIHVITPNNEQGMSPQQEKLFFDKSCSISNQSVYEATYHSLFGCLGSVLNDNHQGFSESLANIQLCEWKRSEWDVQSKNTQKLKQIKLNNGNSPFYLSSLGPTAFSIHDDSDYLKSQINALNIRHSLKTVTPNNSGRVVTYV